MMTTRYTNNLNTIGTDLNKLNNQVASGRKFSRTSEDVSSAMKGYQIRKNIYKVDGYQDNISHAQSFLTNSESSLNGIEDSLSTAVNRVEQGVNGTQSDNEKSIIATELRNLQESLLSDLNTSSAGVHIFGGSNTDSAPFTVDPTTKKLLYNGVDVDSLTDGSAKLKELQQDSLYVDIGLGVSFDSSGKVDRNTVFEYSLPGISIAGNGTTTLKDGTVASNNVYNLIGQLAEAFETGGDSSDMTDKIEALFGHLQEATQKVYQKTTEIGAKTNYLDFMTTRYETQDYNMEARQTEVEGVDAAATYIDFQTQKVAYQAALQMGQSVIQQSVFDYMS
jgi:flagellar hook-associated protein 3 FlgL